MSKIKKPPNAFQRLWKELLEPIVFAVVITQFVGTLVGVDGVSMMPNLRHHERVFVPKYETWIHKAGIGSFSRGDILIFKPPAGAAAIDPNLNRSFLGLWKFRPFLIKRLTGLPGDKIRISKGEVFVNDKAISNDYTASYWQEQGCWDTDSELANKVQSGMSGIVKDQEEFIVPAGQYFVMGDNRTANGSEDSRLFGPVPLRDIAGRAAAVIWPIMRQENAKYNCAVVSDNPEDKVTTSGKSVLNWRILTPPETFKQDLSK